MSATMNEVDAAARSLANLDGVDWPEVDVWGGSWEEFRDRYYEKARRALEAAQDASEPESSAEKAFIRHHNEHHSPGGSE